MSVASALAGWISRLHGLVSNSSSPENEKKIFRSGRIASGDLPLSRHRRTPGRKIDVTLV